ncbi:hypothetical protein RQM47_01635 [Rubrivirga sp. S365]|uniref:Uncharacterized protein n=1 Tax=Rubrivirga litoralis TaxID=3075598 RepID=A0ABU3BPE4_9BACT|nr:MULTISPECIES: hypothetical protein [unclassified Rubrivirga]MDT0631152.1 hypothetical protein [Rubrivirga sp. F394]MDT7855335.1 hypothetical protein [Rubrivirga sp. S365]
MTVPITKPQIVRAVGDLPDDATVEDAMERLLLLSKVGEGLEQARRGETVPHAEVARRMEERLSGWRNRP